jgi:methionyl aminopeptidase
MTIDSDDDLEGVRRVAAVVRQARDDMMARVTPGVTTGELDAIAREVFRRHGARSAPRLTYRFPGATCISVNDEAAHGVPSLSRHLEAGDLVNIDVSAELDGYFADTGISVPVGRVSPLAARLLDATRLAQHDAMEAARPGARLRDIGRAVQRRARRHGFCVIGELRGHGVGRGLHEAPSVPSVDDGHPSGRGVVREGSVLAIEPFLSVSAHHVVEDADGWTLRTSDGSLVAQFEHTMVVTGDGPLVLTA